MKTVTAILHCYSFKPSDPAREELHRELKARDLSKFSAIGADDVDHHYKHIKPLDGQTIELNTENFFNNQWFTVDGLRVFDWNEPYRDHERRQNPKLPYFGYWLELSPEAVALRENTYVCGYCGHHHDDLGKGFCTDCLGSDYLNERELYLLRLLTVAENDIKAKRAPLTEAERKWLLPDFIDAQLTAKRDQNPARMDEAQAAHDKAIAEAEKRLDGLRLIDSYGLPIKNVWYNGQGSFTFGFGRGKYSPSVAAELRALLEVNGFPYDFTIEEGDK